MTSKVLPAFAIAALLVASSTAWAAPAPVPASETVKEGQGQLDGAPGGTWFGIAFTLVTILIIAFHDELFDDDDDEEPVSA